MRATFHDDLRSRSWQGSSDRGALQLLPVDKQAVALTLLEASTPRRWKSNGGH